MGTAPSILDQIGDTPLVSLRVLDRDLPVPVLVKCEHLNPGGSVKDRIAKAIVEDAEERRVLGPGATLIEATAGNTGMGLALVAAARGYKLVCVLPEKMSVDKRHALRALGAEVVVAPTEPLSHPDNFRNMARRLAEENGWFLTEQFENEANIRAHEFGTGPEIERQVRELTGQPIGAFVSGAGTGGTITGVGRHLKRVDPGARIILADPVGSGLAAWVETGEPGESGTYAVEGIGTALPPANLHRDVIDEAVQIPDDESFEIARRLIAEEGLFVGGSAGANVAAALRVAARGDLQGPVVTLGCDSWDRYFSQPWLQPQDP